MSTVFCLDCDRKIRLTAQDSVGDVIVCPSCESEFELISVNPPEIAWLYDDYDDDDDEWEDDDEGDGFEGRYGELDGDNDGEWSWMIAKQRRVQTVSQSYNQGRNRRTQFE